MQSGFKARGRVAAHVPLLPLPFALCRTPCAMQGSNDSDVHAAYERTPLSPFPSVETAHRPCPAPPVAHRSSDYLLVDPASPVRSIDAKDIDLPRPRFWYILPLLGLADLACSLAFIGINARHGRFGRNEAAVSTWGLARSVGVVLATSNIRIREIGWLIVGSAFVSSNRQPHCGRVADKSRHAHPR